MISLEQRATVTISQRADVHCGVGLAKMKRVIDGRQLALKISANSVITKELTKSDSEYAAKQAHCELANKMRKRCRERSQAGRQSSLRAHCC